MSLKKPVSFLLAGACFSFVSSVAFSAADQVPEEAKQQLVSQAESFRKESAKRPEKEPVQPEIIVKKKVDELKEEEVGPAFILKKVELEDRSLFPAKAFEKYLVGFVNREVNYAQLKALTQLITNYYRAAGYTTSYAYLPPQKIENGAVKIKIIEGKVGKITVADNRYFSDKIYAQAIHFDKKSPDGRPYFRYEDFAESLVYLNQKPDRSARGYLEPTDRPEVFDVTLKAKETYPLHAHYEFNNHGTKLTHRARHITSVTHSNFSGRGDLLSGNLTLAEEGALSGVAVGYSYPVEATGTTWSLNTSYTRSMLVKHLKPVEFKGAAWNVTPEISQILHRTQGLTLEGVLALEFKDSKSLIDDLKTSFDRMRIARLGPRASFLDNAGRGAVSSEVHFGIPKFLGSLNEVDVRGSHPNTGGEFIYYTASASRIHRLPASSYLILKANGQWTTDSLTSIEQYRLGGSSSVRGYPEADAVGDYGYTLSSELSLPASALMAGKPADVLVAGLRFAVFVEGGKTFVRERALDTDVKDKRLLGVGFGVRLDPAKWFSLQCDLGWPLGDKSSDENQKQVHLSVRGGF